MKKSILVATLSVLSATSAYAIDIGVGVDINEDNRKIYVPINVTETFRVEPFISNTKVDSDFYSYDRYTELGVGLFKISPLSDKVNLLLGARAAYVEGHYDFDEYDGYSLAPVLGFEYFPVKNVSLGADVSYVYSEVDVDSFYKETSESSGTKTSLGIKFYFN